MPPDSQGQALVQQICSEVADLAKTDEIDAIGVAIVLPDGTVRTLSAYSEGTKFPLLAAMTILQQDFVTTTCRPDNEVELRGTPG